MILNLEIKVYCEKLTGFSMSDFLSDSICFWHLGPTLIKTRLVPYSGGADQRAASGTLLNRATAHLVELRALTRMGAFSHGGCGAVGTRR